MGNAIFKDTNGDRIIDAYDKEPMGYTKIPELIPTVNIGFEWKGLDARAVLTAYLNRTVGCRENMDYGFGWGGTSTHEVVNTWGYYTDDPTDPRNINAKYPRLSNSFSNIDRNYPYNESTIWVVNGDFLSLRNVEVGYSLPKKWIAKATSPWYKLAPELRPEAGLLKLRKSLNLFANLRPAYLYKELAAACPLRSDIIGDGFDMMIMRELTGGLYFGARETKEVDGVVTATDTLTYNENEIRRIAKRGFDIAMKRRKKVTSVDKANVLDSSRLWRKIVEEVAKDYPEVTYEHMLVDNCAMQLVKDPKQFDVILTENMFGDILSDEASMVTGSIGMLSSASLNDTKFGLYEPSGGSAPDIAGKGIANPIATILSAAMMLRYSFDLDKEAQAIEDAVKQVLKEGYRTIDIMPQPGETTEGITQVGTAQMGDLIAERV